jgi:hypothetical protein
MPPRVLSSGGEVIRQSRVSENKLDHITMNAQTPEFFVREILRLKKSAGPGYGDNVLPAMRFYKGLESPTDRKAFMEALELLLLDSDKENRSYGVTLCLGFFVFRDVV